MRLYNKLSDAELTDLLREGDKSAFTEIYNRFFGLLYIHAYRKLLDEAQAGDIIQEIFTTIWDKRNSLHITGSLSSYLYSASRNRILNTFRDKKVSVKFLESLTEADRQDHSAADDRIRIKDLTQLIEAEINALPDPMRVIFIMSRTKNLSHKDIATELNMSEQAVRSQVKRALKILRLKLGLFAYLMILFKFM